MTAFPTHPDSESVAPETEDPTTETETADSRAMFQGVGVIVGSIDMSSEDKMSVTIGQSSYPLLYAPSKRRAFAALKKEIETTGNTTQRLIVYPKVLHFPKKNQAHLISFQLVGFDKGRKEDAVSGELQDFEFKLSGLWQFIPVCSTPCISVFRNFTSSRLETIKQAEPARKVKYLKASHLPVLWKEAPVRPFRFNPKADYDQGRPAFVSLKAKFLPHRNAFGFEALLAPLQEKAPKFLKASKEDKALVQQEAKKNKHKSQSPSTPARTLDATDRTMPAVEGKPSLLAPPKTVKEKPILKKTGN
ncbi:MAG: hypothetical protein JO235_04585 [Chroococcidiopsidaceae cyanobacterium CP_BM_RX_35]|nr:hypothetical protein [Chroococcidiopsidaceae cyanobacterium CP_BM_RX_35]